MPNKFRAGAARVKIPSATLVISKAATIGNDSCTPVLKMRPPQSASCLKPPA